MEKKDKIESLNDFMTRSTRDNGEQFYHFTDEAPRDLVDLFLEHYSVNDLDYQIFSTALSVVSDVYQNSDEDKDNDAIVEAIYEESSDSASYYTSDRLAYITPENEDEVSETMREYGEHSIATAAAIWYDRQVEQAAIIINDWINA